MNEQQSIRSISYKLGGYYLVPHELLHVLAYRLIGKQCKYQLGDYRVRSLQPKNRREKLFVLLFPFVVCWALGFLFGIVWLLSAFFVNIPPERYFVDGPTWHIIFLALGALFILYGGAGHKDLIEAFGWLFAYKKAKDDGPEPEQAPDETKKSFLHKLGGYYAIPHELLHVLAYRLIGKPCAYQWGDYSVRPLAKRTRKERLLIALLPFTVFFGLGLFFQVLWVLSAFFIKIPPERYFIDGPTWHIIFLLIGGLLILYSGTAHYDLINSYYLLFGEYEPEDDGPEPHRSAHNKQQQG